ncbi:hypothetical protein C8J25_101975 [Sphingomonas faeni]|uniref:Uncharacterized protein n=1 Tax=Sphingomonas faeni TaxID=185950 RepID=A0A2T5UD72_9SPHN|nr:hypothetical protein [Sphingomonas faeni]PTW49465.1 hypothetical protein C8J25_101975 [Sphingomonas faeni]
MTPAFSKMAMPDVLHGADATTIADVESPAFPPAQRSREMLRQRLHFVNFGRSA